MPSIGLSPTPAELQHLSDENKTFPIELENCNNNPPKLGDPLNYINTRGSRGCRSSGSGSPAPARTRGSLKTETVKGYEFKGGPSILLLLVSVFNNLSCTSRHRFELYSAAGKIY